MSGEGGWCCGVRVYGPRPKATSITALSLYRRSTPPLPKAGVRGKEKEIEMSVRQFAFCITIGPVLLFWFLVGVIGIFPLLIVIGWLAGEKQPVSVAWDICMVSPIEMLKEGYRGPAS